MATQEFVFNVPFKCFFCIDAPIDIEAVKASIQRLIDYYSDGRFNLERECMERDMGEMVKTAIRSAAYELAKEKWPGNELVQVSPETFSNKAIIEAAEIEKSLKYSGATIKDSKE